MTECRVGIGVRHTAKDSQMDRLAVWIPATWKLGEGLSTSEAVVSEDKAPVDRAS